MKRNLIHIIYDVHLSGLLRIFKGNYIINPPFAKSILFLLLLPFQIYAQDITGLWTGYLQTTRSKVHYEVAISETNDKLGGYSLTVFTFEGTDNTGVKSIKVKNKKGNISLEDGELIYDNYTTPPKKLILSANLSLKSLDSVLILEGTFNTKSLDMRFIDKNEFKGTVYLQKQNNFTQTKLISKLEEMNLMTTLSFLAQKDKEKDIAAAPKKIIQPPVNNSTSSKKILPMSNTSMVVARAKNSINPVRAVADITLRNTEILTTIYCKTDSLLISLFDNGQIDGDTVSVVLNGKVIISKKGLTAKAITQKIYLNAFPVDSIVLIMYAENLGTIPPNTGLLILQDGDTRHEVRFAGDLQKNSAIVLKRKR